MIARKWLTTHCTYKSIRNRHVSETRSENLSLAGACRVSEGMDPGQKDDKARAASCGSGGDVSAPRTTRFRKQLSL